MIGTNRPDRTFKTPLLFWHKGWVRFAAQRTIGKFLENPIESRIFESLPTPALTESIQDHVCWVRRHDGLRPFFLFVPRLTSYKVEDAYEQAKVSSDGQHSPHTALRSLSSGDSWEALDFVNEFGPLELLDESEPRQTLRPEDLLDFGEGEEVAPKERCVWVDVNDFWKKQQRFVAIAELWESRESVPSIRSALSKLAMLSIHPPIGARRYEQGFAPGSVFPWQDGYFHKWESKADEKQLRNAAAEIIARELDLNTDRMRLSWACSNPSRLQFQLVPFATSLWSAIWHLLARDTSAGIGWRICPHCSKLFYPQRRDSYFCEPKYQKLNAANRWWKEHSEEELDKRRKERVKTRPTRKKTERNRRTKGKK